MRGAPTIIAASFAVGVAGTMVPVSFVLFARQATNSFGSASLVLAALTAGRLLLSPRRGRMVDRLGPSRTLLWLVPPATATDIAFILAGRAHPSPLVLIAAAALSGAVSAPAATVIRSVWSGLLPDNQQRRTGFALMSVLGEVNFFTGPLLAGVLVAVGSPTLAVAAGAGLNGVGGLALASSAAAKAVKPKAPAESRGRFPALAGAGIRYVVTTSALFGLTFGLLDVAWPAFARIHGTTAAAGLFASLFAVGALIGGLAYGTLEHRRTAISLYPKLCLLAAAGLAPLVAAQSILAMSLLAVLSGLCFAPITTVQISAVDEVAPEAHRAEAFTWLGTVYGVGSSAGAAIAGQLIVLSGTRAALGAAATAAAAAWLLTTIRKAAIEESARRVAATARSQ